MTASVSEQCAAYLPDLVEWEVDDVSSSTPSEAQFVVANNIVFSSETKQLRLSIKANAASFTPPDGSGTTWAASDVSWNGCSWTNGTGAAGTLSDSSYNVVVTSAARPYLLATMGLVFTLAAKSSVSKSGDHTLVCTWKVESIGT